MQRRSLLLAAGLAIFALVACKKTASTAAPEAAGRCAFCGMQIKADNAFRVTATLEGGGEAAFDSPRCAFEARANAKYKVKTLRMQEFYDRTWHDPSELRFVIGSDVMGPMGHDVIPVLASHEQKFMKDHKGKRAVGEKEITESLLDHLGENP